MEIPIEIPALAKVVKLRGQDGLDILLVRGIDDPLIRKSELDGPGVLGVAVAGVDAAEERVVVISHKVGDALIDEGEAEDGPWTAGGGMSAEGTNFALLADACDDETED